MAREANQQDELDRLVDAAEPARRNLGNLPDDEPPAQHAETPEPEPPPAPEPEATPAPSPTSEDIATLRARQEALEKELLFTRAALNQPPAAPPSPPQEGLVPPFQVSEQDVQTILAGGPQAAQLLTGAMALLYQRAVTDTEKRLVTQYAAVRQHDATAGTIRQQFTDRYGALLQKAPEIVAAKAQEVEREYPGVDPRLLLDEVARRTTARAKELGVSLDDSAPKPKRLKPARLEGGGSASARGSGSGTKSQTERDVDNYFTRQTGLH